MLIPKPVLSGEDLENSLYPNHAAHRGLAWHHWSLDSITFLNFCLSPDP